MSNRYSTFPDKLDELKLLSEVQNMTLDQKQKASRCNELSLKPSLTVAEENEFLRLVEELKGFNISSVDWNKVVETLMNTQEYIKNNILSDVGEMADNAEEHIRTYTEEMLDEVYSVTESSKIEIDNVKADAISSVQVKAEELIAEGNIGVDTLKGYVVLQEASDRVRVNIPEYNKNRDILMVYINGSLVSEGVVYTMMADNFTIKAVEGTWDVGTVFNFIVNKKTIFKLDYYDVGLIEDGSIVKGKLTQELQDEITNSTNNKQNITELTLTTTAKKIPLAINELNLNKQPITDNTLTTTAKKIPLAINELNSAKGDLNLNQLTKGFVKKNNLVEAISESIIQKSTIETIYERSLSAFTEEATTLNANTGEYVQLGQQATSVDSNVTYEIVAGGDNQLITEIKSSEAISTIHLALRIETYLDYTTYLELRETKGGDVIATASLRKANGIDRDTIITLKTATPITANKTYYVAFYVPADSRRLNIGGIESSSSSYVTWITNASNPTYFYSEGFRPYIKLLKNKTTHEAEFTLPRSIGCLKIFNISGTLTLPTGATATMSLLNGSGTVLKDNISFNTDLSSYSSTDGFKIKIIAENPNLGVLKLSNFTITWEKDITPVYVENPNLILANKSFSSNLIVDNLNLGKYRYIEVLPQLSASSSFYIDNLTVGVLAKPIRILIGRTFYLATFIDANGNVGSLSGTIPSNTMKTLLISNTTASQRINVVGYL